MAKIEMSGSVGRGHERKKLAKRRKKKIMAANEAKTRIKLNRLPQ